MRAFPAYRIAVSSVATLLLAGTALAAPQVQPHAQSAPEKTVEVSLETPKISLRPVPTEPLTCAQRCDVRAEQTLKTCLRTVAVLQSDPNWMDEALSADTCGKAAVSGADQCRKRCEPETMTKTSGNEADD